MGNKYIKLLILLVVLIGGGTAYQKYYRPTGSSGCKTVGPTKEFRMVSKENKWYFDPAEIRVKKCDHVVIHIFNEDVYDHGFAIDVFGVNRRLNPKRETTVDFTHSISGDFPFYCSVACGEGHYRHTGMVIVEE